MTEEELAAKNFLDLFGDSKALLTFMSERLPEAEQPAKQILEARENYPEWKKRKDKAREVFLAASELINILLRIAMA